MAGKEVLNVALVSANFNNGSFLQEFIESILASHKQPAQIIIVDDGSTDNSRQILKEYEYIPGATFIYLTTNEGFANALNKGIAAVNSDYIMRADPDDILDPSKLEKQFEFLQSHPEISGVGCNVEYFHFETSKHLNRSNFPVGWEEVKKAYLKGEHGMQHPTVMMKTGLFKKFHYHQKNVPAEDYDLFARLISHGYNFANLSEVLYKMRIHPDSASNNLNFETIRKTFELSNEIFGLRSSECRQRLYYYHILNYRRYLLNRNIIKKVCFLLLSVLLYPHKLARRIKLWIN